MHASLYLFLLQHGARFRANTVADFGDPITELRAVDDGVLLSDLSQEGFIRVDGADARNFLQGQLSTDIRSLTPFSFQFSSWNNVKGRVVTLLRLCEQDGSIYMSLPRMLVAPVLKRLSMYILRSNVTLTDASDSCAHIGLAGSEAPALLKACSWRVPPAENMSEAKDGITLMRLYGPKPRFVMQGVPDKLTPIWDALKKQGAVPAGEAAWDLARILARVPVVFPETSEHFVAQMLGLEELGALNFRKGCYIGQEVIARAHYRGAVKRHLHRASCISDLTIQPGTSLCADDAEYSVGEVVDARQDSHGIIQMLIVLQDDYQSKPLYISGMKKVSLLE